MFKLLVFVLFAWAQALAESQAEIKPYIVGGTPAAEGAYPFIVSFRDDSGFYCGGSLITKQFVLTAAHCILSESEMRVGVGSVNLAEQSIFEVEKTFVHPDYVSAKKGDDIALVKLKKPVEFSSKVQTIKFPYWHNLNNKTVTAMGWGLTKLNGEISPVLLELKRPITSNVECNEQLEKTDIRVKKSHICLGGVINKGVCFGDSGSPLLYKRNTKNYIIGVASMAIPCAKGFPDVYMRVSHYTDWIRKTIS